MQELLAKITPQSEKDQSSNTTIKMQLWDQQTHEKVCRTVRTQTTPSSGYEIARFIKYTGK